MLTYLLVAVTPLVFTLFFPKVNVIEKRKRNYLILCGIFLVLFMGLRSKYVGSTDSLNYFNMMGRAIARSEWVEFYSPEGVESGFQLFVFLLSRLFKEPQVLLFASSLIIVSCVFYSIYKNSENVVLSVTMYITLGLMQFEMQGMRQALAMSLCILAFEFVKQKRIIPFAITVIIATQFHRTAILFLAVYFVALMAYNWKSILIISIGSVTLFYFAGTIMDIANDVFETEYSMTVDSGGFMSTVLYIAIIIFAMICNRYLRFEKENKIQSAILFVTVMGMVSYIMRYFGAVISERISYYFMFGQLLLLPNTLSTLQTENKKLINGVVYVFCFALFAYRLRGSDFIPYEFFWSLL